MAGNRSSYISVPEESDMQVISSSYEYISVVINIYMIYQYREFVITDANPNKESLLKLAADITTSYVNPPCMTDRCALKKKIV